MGSFKPGRIDTSDTVDRQIRERDIQEKPPDSHSKRPNASQSVEGAGDRIEITGVTNGRHFDKFVNEIAVCGRHFHFQTEQTTCWRSVNCFREWRVENRVTALRANTIARSPN